MTDDEQFQQQVQGNWDNHKSEWLYYLDAWLDYHRACEKFDRSLSPTGVPRNSDEHILMNRHAQQMHKIFIEPLMVDTHERRLLSRRAKIEATRIVEAEYNRI